MRGEADVAGLPSRVLDGGNGTARFIEVVRELREVPVPVQQDVPACCAPIRAETPGSQDARGLAALGEPVRLQLLSLRATSPGGAACVCDPAEPVGESEPTVSHHPEVLREAGLATSEKRGTDTWHAVVPAALEALSTTLTRADA